MAGKLPSYDDLIARKDAPSGSSWDVFGAGDDVGTVNLLTPDRVRRSAELVLTGKSFSLDYAINAFSPPTAPVRKNALHTIYGRQEYVRDDYIDSLYPQAGSQMDGLRHVADPSVRFYGGAKPEDIQVGTKRLGVQRWAERGIVGRGVLLDVERYLAAQGARLDHEAAVAFDVALLDRVAASSNVSFEQGDILLIHTGWSRHYLQELDEEGRAAFRGRGLRSCGLVQSRQTLEWLWDHHFAALASDTSAFEAYPTSPNSPFDQSFFGGMMHPDLIALLGFCVGELWRLNELAADCAADNVFECMVISKPLNIVGGVGSPPNAMALK